MRLKQHGFTLLEIIISITLLIFIAGIAYSSLRGIIRSKDILEDQREARMVASSVLRRMARELQLAYSGIPIMQPEDNRNENYSNRTYLAGEPGKQGENSADAITFMALEGGQYLPDGGTHSGVVQISYRVAPDPEGQEINGSKTYYLVREEMPNLRPYQKAAERAMRFPLTKNLLSLQFRYYDPEEDAWVSDWGGGKRVKLPSMVKMRIEMISDDGVKKTYMTAVPLRRSEEL